MVSSRPTTITAAAALRAHMPELAHLPLEELGGGLDNAAFRAGDVVLRVAADGHDVVREARLLGVVARHVSVGVPRPLFADREAGVMAYPMIAGRPLLGRTAPDGLAQTMGRFLRELHAIDLGDVGGLVDDDPADPERWLEDLDGPPDLIEALRTSVPPPGRRRVLAHADLGAEHLLEHDGALAGVIDWSDAAITDPALDLARPYRDFGPGFLAELLEAYGDLDDARPRIEFFARCAALEDLGYGRATGAREYVRAAERSLRWLFRDERR